MHNYFLSCGLTLSALFTVISLPAQNLLYNDFSTFLPATASGNTMDAVAADIDGDGDPDVILAMEFQQNRILINSGNAHFSDGTAGRLSNKTHDSEDIAVADFNGDGALDIVFVSEDDTTHEYYLNDGTGYFTDVSDSLPYSKSNAVAAGDLNNDGFIDLYLGNDGQDLILINSGQGYFTDETANRLPVSMDVTQDVLLLDIDGDLDLDVILGNEDGNKIYINSSLGIFTDESATRLPQSGNMETRKIDAGDIDNDGDMDLFLSNVKFIFTKDPQDKLYANDGTGYFTDITSDQFTPEVLNTLDAEFVDVDLDGDKDIVSVSFPDGPYRVYENGYGYFYEYASPVIPDMGLRDGLAVVTADFNGDGLPDLYFGNRGEDDKLLLRNIVSGLGEEDDKGHFNIYPNPSSDMIQILPSGNLNEIESISLKDISGKILQQKTVNPGSTVYEMSLQDLAAGTYFIELKTVSATYRHKVVRS